MRKNVQWHSAFFACLNSIFSEEREILKMEMLRSFGKGPLRGDVLIKKETEQELKPSIGRLFRKYNIIAYTGPNDYLSPEDYNRTYEACCSFTEVIKEDDAQAEDAQAGGTQTKGAAEERTLTFVSHRYPRKVISHLRYKKKFQVEEQEDGIYYITGAGFPMQLIVASRLSGEQNFWLKHLTYDLKDRETARRIAEEYRKHREDIWYQSMMNAIVSANRKLFSKEG